MYNTNFIPKTYPQPGVYQIVQYKHEDRVYHNLVFKYDKFDTPKKVYGDIMTNVTKIWNAYALEAKTTGCIMVGNSGSGKSLMGYILSNIAIINQLPVVICTELDFTTETIQFLSVLSDCVIFLDEFKKNIGWSVEDKMLTMLADPKNTRKLFIITENDAARISSFIINRPERARYYFEFDKISPAVFKDYCKDFNIATAFYQELEDKYTIATVFSFDHLQAIVNEHLHYPNETLDSIIGILNVPILRKPLYIKVKEVIREDDNKKLEFSVDEDSLTLIDYKNQSYRYIYLQVWETSKSKADKEEPLFKLDLKFNMLSQAGASTSFVYEHRQDDKKYKIILKAE